MTPQQKTRIKRHNQQLELKYGKFLAEFMKQQETGRKVYKIFVFAKKKRRTKYVVDKLITAHKRGKRFILFSQCFRKIIGKHKVV